MSTSPVRVVVVDDHDDLRLLLRTLLQIDGRFELVGEAADGDRGFRAIADTSPDLVILDLAMPGIDGLELLDMCRQQWPHLPIVAVLSGFNRAVMGPVAMERGAVGYLEKGILTGTEILDELWSLWQEHGVALTA